jgi:hypothetical protein
MHRSLRIVLFGTYALLNLAIIVFAIALWFRGLPMEAVFIGLWAPTLDLLYVMALLTFDPWRRVRAAAVDAEQPWGPRTSLGVQPEPRVEGDRRAYGPRGAPPPRLRTDPSIGRLRPRLDGRLSPHHLGL